MALWKRLWAALPRLSIAVLIIAIIAIIVFIGVAYYTGVFPEPDWTGFGTPKVNADGQEISHFKTLWDWLGLLLVPLVLAIGGFFLTRSENRYALQLQALREEEARKIEEQRILEARKIEEQRTQEAREIEKERAQDAALQAYLDQMTQLLLHEKLSTSQPRDDVRSVARARTLTVLRVLDGVRKATVLQFLYETRLIGGIKREEGGASSMIDAIVGLYGANLEGAQLQRANLIGAQLVQANLANANFSGAFLFEAQLEKANLAGANLSAAHARRVHLLQAQLSGANLEGAQLSGANLEGAQLSGANLSGATLDGATLYGAPLDGARFDYTDLSHCDITREHLATAKSFEGVILPFEPAPEVEVAAQEDQTNEQAAAPVRVKK